MQKSITLEYSSPLCRPAPAASDTEHVLNVTVVYEDAAACQWAREAYNQMVIGAGKQTVRGTWWKLEELSHPPVLAGAVSKAMRADVIVVAIRTTEGFPLPFYVWVNSWLPHRVHGAGTLVALIATPDQTGLNRRRAADYLRAVARRARMHFQITERSVVRDAA